MRPPEYLSIELLSDTTFARSEGTAGMVDVDVEHDAYGVPFVGGKAVRGLLRDSWLSMQPCFSDLQAAACRVFGTHGDTSETAIVRIGDALVEERARDCFAAAVERTHNPLNPEAILASLTEVRTQTSEARETGAPARNTLRTVRVVLRGLRFWAHLSWLAEPTQSDVQCLALACLATRHAGLARNRGRGHIRVLLDGDGDVTRNMAGGAS